MKTTDFNITINENADKINFADFGNGSTDEWIKRAEKRLGVKFPNTYTYWLKNYFGGEINGDEIYSVYEMDFDTLVGGDIVYMNELNRKDGFISKDELLIQTNDQAMMYYFDLKQMDEEGEAPVYVKFGDIMEKYADDFFEFIAKKVKE